MSTIRKTSLGCRGRESRIYVAGASAPSERSRVREVMNAIEGSPRLELVHDWLSLIERTEEWEMSRLERVDAAIVDLGSIDSADAVLLLLPRSAQSIGAWVELGYAMARGKAITISGVPPKGPGEDWRDPIFVEAAVSPLGAARFCCDLDAVQWLEEWATGARVVF